MGTMGTVPIVIGDLVQKRREWEKFHDDMERKFLPSRALSTLCPSDQEKSVEVLPI